MSDDTSISPEDIQALIDELAEPIDFALLESEGLIEKEGAWYRLKNPHGLPGHASRKIRTIKQDARGVLVKFDSDKPYQALKERLR